MSTKGGHGGAWTPERVEHLRKMWAEGLSATQIARVLGSITRSAVLGKVNRLKLQSRQASSAAQARVATAARRKRKSKSKTQVSTHVVAVMAKVAPTPLQIARVKAAGEIERNGRTLDADIPLTQRKTIQSLTSSSCRWPVGDPRSPEFFFCGGEAVPGLPYCASHSARAFRPPELKTQTPRTPASVEGSIIHVHAKREDLETA